MWSRRVVACLALLTACSSSSVLPSRVPTITPEPSPSKAQDATFRFAVIGDWGAGTSAQAQIAKRLCSVKSERPIRFLVTTGDNFYRPDGRANRANFGAPMSCLMAAGVEWRATWGNHDVAGTSTATTLGSPSRYYRWSFQGVDLFMLDSNDVSAVQTRWLGSALASSNARIKVVVFHHPPFTAGLHSPDQKVQRAWVPLFERYHVTLVLNGHNHDYEHSKVKGIDYVVSGGGGAETYPCLGFPSYLITCKSVHHFLMVEVAAGSLTVSAVDAGGSAFDTFTVAVV